MFSQEHTLIARQPIARRVNFDTATGARHSFNGSQAGTRSQSAVAAPLCRRTPYDGSLKHFARQRSSSSLDIAVPPVYVLG